ncbi:hypothetical protein JKP28_20850 [Vibrio vulnificus]|uniref:hypothetical protein n=1 Tax=Vibrio vulnificus TaxID=672 RepID=UPI001029C50D|nr:hypothetical protein [Vibrio vulnificus]ELL0598851.1 hypothetical protein [Vibrio vulnificus]ELV8742435.1 hypothetical protein [Vibrio vulnificus]MCA3962487.1 hypothetical protein [Vibrio vulnificus]MCG6293939.1 hypothetical protein [Vibrio vulnificus]RZP55481.1 hypothetical protein D8T47_21625 [Vibrio vulnificus]
MELSQTILSYDGESGQSAIRTIVEDNIRYYSLIDVVKAISAENRRLEPDKPFQSLMTLVRAHVTHLLPDEIRSRENLPANIDEPLREAYVTREGLLRVVLQDKSKACIKFQKWVLGDIVPTVLETGSYSVAKSDSGTQPAVFDAEQQAMLWLQEIRERKQADAAIKSEVNQIAIDVDQIKRTVGENEFILVSEHHLAYELTDSKIYELFVHCLNLCSSKSDVYKASRIKEGNGIDSKAFTLKTIDAAFQKLT